jgi:hypothetical protein
VEAAGLNKDEMTLIIKRFKTALKGRKEYPNKNKSRGKRSCFKCGKSVHFIAQCPDNDNDQAQEKKRKKERKKNYRKAKGEAHIGKEWDSDCSSSDSDDEGLVASAFNKSPLFPNERHTCLMAKENKVHIRDTPKYTSSSDEESSNDEVDYSSLFKGLDRSKVDKINKLIDALNEKDRLLEKQEDILYEEHDKFINVQKSLALEIKKNEILTSELSTCNDSISKLKNLNVNLNAKLEEVNIASSSVEHVVICHRCKDVNIDACNEHASTILKLNNDVASFNAQLKTCNLNKEKGKAPMASSSKKNHAYLYDKRFTSIAHHDRCYDHVVSHVCHNDAFSSHAMSASSSSYAHGRNRPRRHHAASHAPRRASTGLSTLYQTCDASFILLCKNDKVVVRSLGPKCKRDKTCIWVPKSVVTNLVGTNKSWVPKTQA